MGAIITLPLSVQLTNGTTADAAQVMADLNSISNSVNLNAMPIATMNAPGGAGQVGFQQSGANAVARTVQAKLQEVVSVKDFGAVGDGVTNDTPAVLAAAQSLGAAGGTVVIPVGMKCLIDTALTIPANVTLQGPHNFVGSPATNANAPYGNLGGAAIINSTATITLSGGASARGLLVYRKGMTFPAADSSAFAGTAFTAGGDDTGVFNSMVLGFNKAYLCSGYQRPRGDYIFFDCQNGIEITNCLDIPYFSRCHGWPFASIAQGTKAANWADRGTAYYIHDTVDWAKLTDCFSYGYLNGFNITNANSTTLKGCGTDGTQARTGSIGFNITGSTQDTRLVSCQAAAQDTGYYINTNTGVDTLVMGCFAWGNTVSTNSRNYQVQSGDAMFIGSLARQGNTGVYINNAASRVLIDGCRFQQMGVQPIYNNLSSPYVFIGANDYGDLANSTSPVYQGTAQQIASADPLPVPATLYNDYATVTGTTSFGGIAGGYAGRRLTLTFSGACSLFHGGAAPNGMILSGAATFTTAANSSISFVHNGSVWVETGRKA